MLREIIIVVMLNWMKIDARSAIGTRSEHIHQLLFLQNVFVVKDGMMLVLIHVSNAIIHGIDF